MKSIEIGERRDQIPGKKYCPQTLGFRRLMSELGNYAEAAAYFRTNLVLAREIGDQRRLAMNLNYLSLTALHTHDLDSAQHHAQQALAVAHSIRCEPDVLSSIAYVAHVWARRGNV